MSYRIIIVGTAMCVLFGNLSCEHLCLPNTPLSELCVNLCLLVVTGERVPTSLEHISECLLTGAWDAPAGDQPKGIRTRPVAAHRD